MVRLQVWHGINMVQLSKIMAVDSVQDIKEVFAVAGVEVPPHARAPIDAKVFSKVANKAGCKFEIIANPVTAALKAEASEANLDVVKEPYPDIKDMAPKAPVVTLVGHVDHGKTTVMIIKIEGKQSCDLRLGVPPSTSVPWSMDWS